MVARRLSTQSIPSYDGTFNDEGYIRKHSSGTNFLYGVA